MICTGDKKGRDNRVYRMGTIGIKNLQKGDVVEPELSIRDHERGLEVVIDYSGERTLQNFRVVTDCGNTYNPLQIRRYGRAIR